MKAKFVNESVENILKPKSQDEIDVFLNYFFGVFKFLMYRKLDKPVWDIVMKHEEFILDNFHNNAPLEETVDLLIKLNKIESNES